MLASWNPPAGPVRSVYKLLLLLLLLIPEVSASTERLAVLEIDSDPRHYIAFEEDID